MMRLIISYYENQKVSKIEGLKFDKATFGCHLIYTIIIHGFVLSLFHIQCLSKVSNFEASALFRNATFLDFFI